MVPSAGHAYPRRRFVLCLAFAAMMVVALLASAAPSRAALPGSEGFGITTGGAIQSESPAVLNRELDAIRNAGSEWIRIDINWAQIQSRGPSSYDWAAIDRLVRGARDRGLQVLGGILYTPDWARPPRTDATFGPDPARYAKFAGEAAAHYSRLGVHAYEIWNEPNTQSFWTPRPNIADYTELLKAAYPAIKAADPKATVLSGGTAPAPTDGISYSPVDFLRGVYAHGGGGSFDAVAHHPYCWPAYPGEPESWSAWYQMYGTKPSLRSLMTAHGDAGKEIWATEFGAPTDGPRGSHVSERTQARMLTTAYRHWRRYDWSGPMFAYQGRDQGNSKRTRENFFGMLRNDWSPKPAYAAYQRAVAVAEGGPMPPTPTTTKVRVDNLRKGRARRAVISGRVAPAYANRATLSGAVKLRLYRRVHGRWRPAGRGRETIGPAGRFRTRIGMLRRRSLKPGAYRVRARYLGSSSIGASRSRSRSVKLRS